MRTVAFFLTFSLLFALGCSRGAPAPSWQGLEPAVGNVQAMNNLRQFGLAADAEGRGEAERAEGRSRKLVYQGEVDLLVANLDAAGQELMTVLQAHKGILANSEIVSSPGAPRVGLWRVRVPAEEFDAFHKAVTG